MKIQSILLTVLLLTTAKIFAQPISETQKEAITQILYKYASDDSPGIAVGLVQDGQTAYQQCIGYANLEHQIKVNKDTRFNIASNAKQFTALCILKLQEAGKINVEDDIRDYLPDLFQNIPDKITISNLLTHTSGVRDYCDLLALQGKTWWKQFIDNKDALELLQNQSDLNFKPGTEFLYSNSNYILLTEIVKTVTGQNFSAFAKTLFESLDMPSTNFLSNYTAIIPNKARPYGSWKGWYEEPTITEVHGDGALFTSLEDQLKWEQILQANDGKYLSKTLIDQSQLPIENAFTKDYGYGLQFDTNRGLDYAYHDGVTGSYHATFLRFKNLSIVVMSNNQRVPTDFLAWEIALLVFDLENDQARYLGDPDQIEPLKRIQDVLGIYKGDGEDGTIIKITEKDGALYREIYQRDPVKLIPEQGGLFEYESIKGLKMNFTNIGQADQKFTLYKSTQKPSNYYKLPNSGLNRFDRDELNGRFYNEETDTEIILKFVEDDTYSLTKNGRERQAKLVLKDYLRMMDTYEIKIVRDEAKQVVGLNVKNRRIKNVIFNKI